MAPDSSVTVMRWILAGLPLFLGSWILLFNVLRYTPLVRGRAKGGDVGLPSSVPFAGTVFVLIGLALAPMEFRLAFLGVALLEVFSINFSRAGEDGSRSD